MKDWSASSLGERLTHAVKLRRVSLNELGRLTGLTGGPVSRLARRKERIAGSPEGLVKLADALEIELRWLVDGTGPIERTALGATAEDRRLLAAALAREDGLHEEAIEAILREPIRAEDAHRSTLWWARKIRMHEAALDSGGPEGTHVRVKNRGPGHKSSATG